MMFFKIECKTNEDFNIEDKKEFAGIVKSICELNKKACEEYSKDAIFSVVRIKEKSCEIVAVARFEFTSKISIESGCNSFLDFIELKGSAEKSEETTKNAFFSALRFAERTGYINDDNDIIIPFELESRGFERTNNYREMIINAPLNFTTATKKAKNLLCAESIEPELGRIFSDEGQKSFSAHPVHYMINSNDNILSEKITELLLCALSGAGRLVSKRYGVCSLLNNGNPANDMECFEKAYLAAEGGAMIIKCDYEENESEFADLTQRKIRDLCEMMKKHRQTVLTVFCISRSNEKLKNTVFDLLETITFVELTEEIVFADKAKAYLKMLAQDKDIKDCAELFKALPKSETGYLAADLNKMFDSWYDKYLRTGIYPQYATLEKTYVKVIKPKGNAYKDLQEMIGLTQSKAVLAQAIDYYKAQKLFKEKGVQNERPAMHMIFTGNPGTAKTSVARLIAQIMKDNNLLSVGDLLEVGRADLIGKYVGHTAPLVKAKFKQAKGSVLFIDEAYSLVDDRDGLYGDEAINTIVQEMENARENTVVIFAGYPDKMDGFLNKNPGLRSRIAFHVEFPDYTVEELMDITRLMVKNQKLTLAEDAAETIMAILGNALKKEDFGNGRYVRNLLEKARMKQATRLVKMDYDAVTAEVASTLIADDFEMPALNKTGQKFAIGF